MGVRKGIVALVGAGLLATGVGGVSYGQVAGDNDTDNDVDISDSCNTHGNINAPSVIVGNRNTACRGIRESGTTIKIRG